MATRLSSWWLEVCKIIKTIGSDFCQYLKTFYLAVDDARLQPELRKKVADLTLKLYKSRSPYRSGRSESSFLELLSN